MTNRPSPSRPSRPAAPRGGFTIIELAVVVLIIGILVALLFPAIRGAMRAARDAEVVTEMSTLDKAIVDFKARFGVEPPSFIVIYEQGDDGTSMTPDPGWGADTGSPLPETEDAYRRASRAVIRQMWPEFDFSYAAFGGEVDLNDDGDETDVLILTGVEALVFFLGGRADFIDTDGDGTDESYSPVGFAANPRAPFDTTGNRVGPFHEFDISRLVDLDDDGMPELVDPLPSQTEPYAYVSSYEGRGYQPWGLDDTASTAIDNDLYGLDDIYYEDDALTHPQNPGSYQLISPGEDFEFGDGGVYNGEGVGAARPFERDNITNFKGGRLN
jgi:general secretion pathway protein G